MAVGMLSAPVPVLAQGSGPDFQAMIDPAGFTLTFEAPAGKADEAGKRLQEIELDALFSHDATRIKKALDEGAKAGVARVFGLTPLHLAALRGDTTAIGLLLDGGAAVNAGLNTDNAGADWRVAGLVLKQVKEVPLSTGLTPLHLAAAFGHDKAVVLLAKNGAAINAANYSGQTPLKYALLFANFQKAVQALVLRGADLTTQDSLGESPFMIAAMAGDIRIVRLALLNGAAVNAASRKGITALHFAADQGHRDIVELLLNSKADPRLREAGGRTAYDLAAANGHKEIAALLKKRGGGPEKK